MAPNERERHALTRVSKLSTPEEIYNALEEDDLLRNLHTLYIYCFSKEKGCNEDSAASQHRCGALSLANSWIDVILTLHTSFLIPQVKRQGEAERRLGRWASGAALRSRCPSSLPSSLPNFFHVPLLAALRVRLPRLDLFRGFLDAGRGGGQAFASSLAASFRVGSGDRASQPSTRSRG